MMRVRRTEPQRRSVLLGLGAAGLCAVARPLTVAAEALSGPLRKAIPSSGEPLPVIGMGSWITFNVGDDQGRRDHRVEVLRAFFKAGGGMIDSSPMYGASEEVIGYCLETLGRPESGFTATKVWTRGQESGVKQMATSERLWGTERFDLLQIHNLLGWEGHLETLLDWKARGRVRYLGITTSHGRRHGDFAAIMAAQPLDFVQLTYNIHDREAEARLLPLAAERGQAVIVNRPFQRGGLFQRVAGKPLPGWAGEIDCDTWAQAFLKFVVSHPAVTCAIPATSRIDHMRENMAAARGQMPDAALRKRMADDFARL